MNPEAPVTRTVLLIRKKRPFVLFKLVDGPLVIVGPADVEPIPAERFDVDWFVPCQHVPHEIVKPVFHARGHAVHERTVDDIHPHTDKELVRGLLAETRQPVVAVDFEHTVVDNVGARRRGDRKQTARGYMCVTETPGSSGRSARRRSSTGNAQEGP